MPQQLKITLDLGTVMLNAPSEIPKWFHPLKPEPLGEKELKEMLQFTGPSHLKPVADAMRKRCTHSEGKRSYDVETVVKSVPGLPSVIAKEDLETLQDYEKQLDWYLETIKKKQPTPAAMQFCHGIAWKVYYAGKILKLIREGKLGIKSTDINSVVDLEN